MGGSSNYFSDGLEVMQEYKDSKGNVSYNRVAVGEDKYQAYRIAVALNFTSCWSTEAMKDGKLSIVEKHEITA